MRTSHLTRFLLIAAAGTMTATATIATGSAQHQHDGHKHDAPSSPAPSSPTPTSPTVGAPGARAPRRVGMEELHRAGGVPRGWKFTVPSGDPSKGRQVFADLECYKCHAIKGELLPAPSNDPTSTGPELTGMGAHHPAEYFAESILAPNHVILEGPGYSGPDGLSTMPSFIDTLSLAQWVDVVAYLKSLTGPSDAPHHKHEIEREQVAGDYRIRLVYVLPTHADGHHAGGQHQTGGQGTAGAKPALGRLSVFVTDRAFDEPVPYLPVSAAVQAVRRPTERLRLVPKMDERGFHYAAELTLPPQTQKVTVAIGPTTMQLADSVKGKFTQPVSVVFDWAPAMR
jgi:mono/diheme cytochrome c family protein